MYGDGNSTKNYLYSELCDFADDSGIEDVVEIFSDVLEYYFYDFKERKEEELRKEIEEARAELEKDYAGYKEKYEAMKKVMNSND